MKELNNMAITQVSDADLSEMFSSQVIGTTAYAFISGK